MLVEMKGIEIDEKDDQGQTALGYGLQYPEILQFLQGFQR